MARFIHRISVGWIFLIGILLGFLVTVVGAQSAQPLLALWIQYTAETQTVASDGAGTAASLTFTPKRSYVLLACNDPDGNNITLGEPAASASGFDATIINNGSSFCTFTNSSGVLELHAATVRLAPNDTMTLRYRDRWTLTAVSSFEEFAVRKRSETLGAVVSIFDNGTSNVSMLDIVSDDTNPFGFRVWNKTYNSVADNDMGLNFYQADTGDMFLYTYGGPTGTDGQQTIAIIPPVSNQQIGDAGLWLYANIVGDSFPNSAALAITRPASNPSASTITNVGTPGATTYTYRLVGKTNLGYHTAAGSASTTTTGNATLNGSNYNRIALPTSLGAQKYDIYRTVGGATQGKIGSDVAVASFPFSDTGLAGDSSDVTLRTNTTGHVLAEPAADIVVASYTFANLPSGTSYSGVTFPKEGQQAWITDSNTNTWGATIAGGGANKVLAVYNGTNWTVVGK